MDRILVVGAHYDDSELGAGGLAARLVSEKKKVYKMTLTDTEVFSDDMNLSITSDRAKENSKNAAQVIGMEEVTIKTSPFGKLEYSKETMQEIEHFLTEKEIDTCIFHYSDDYNTDHLAASRICKTAARHCDNLLMFQSNPYIIAEGFYPNVFFDVSEFIEKKREALSCYDKEHDRQGRLFDTNIERNKIWGYGNHCQYAEGFVAIKMCI